MSKNPVTLGVMLFIITMLIFFVVYYFFGGFNFFDISLKVNAFLLPVIYCAAAFFSVKNHWQNHREINFREAFKRAFLPMFVGGFLSMLSIFIFINFVDSNAKDLLNHQYLERQRTELNNEYTKAKAILKNEADKQDLEKKYRERLQSVSPDRTKNLDMFAAKNFAAYFGAIFLFYVVISAFLGAFFRRRNSI